MAARAKVEIRQQFQFPVVEDFGADGGQIGAREDVEHLQHVGRADFAGQSQDHRLVVHVFAERHVRHQQVSTHQEPQRIRVLLRESQSLRHFDGDQRAHFAVIVVVAFAQVVDQQGQVQQPLVAQVAIGRPNRARIREERGGASTARMECSSTVYL